MGNSIPQDKLFLMAQAELQKQPQYKFHIPPSVLQAKIQELSNLSEKDIQTKISEYFTPEGEVKEGWGLMGLELNPMQQMKEIVKANEKQQPQQPTVSKQRTSYSGTDTRKFASKFLLNNAKNAEAKLQGYRDSFGYISSDAVYHGLQNIGDWTWDSITGRNDFVGYHENSRGISKEISALQKLGNVTTARKEFEKQFKEIYGRDFNQEAFDKLEKADNELNTLNANESLSKYLQVGIDKISKTANVNDLGFELNAYLNPLFGNINKTQEFINNLKQGCKTDEEFKAKVLETLNNSKESIDKNVSEILSKTTREELESNYKEAYKGAMGDYHSSEIIDKFIENSQRNAMYTEMAIIIASSVLTMGSSAVQGLGAKAVTKFGAKAGGHVFKAGMTVATASLSSVETVASALTSKDGLTEAKLNEAGEQLKSGLIFGAFGAYVSGPIGDKVVSLLKSNPNITSTIMQKVFSGVGFGTEITADALFELGLSGGDVKSLFAENATGEALGRMMNMILGGRAHQASKSILENISIKQDMDADGTPKYSVVQDGKVLFETKDQSQVLAGLTSIAAEANGVKIEDIETGKTEINGDTKEIPSLSEVDIYSKMVQEVAAPVKFSRKILELTDHPKAQKQVGNYLDYLLKSIPVEKNVAVDPTEVRAEADFILPNGTLISRKRAGDMGEVVWDEKTQKYTVPEDVSKLVFWVKDINGEEHIIPATTKENIEKSQQLINYLATLEAVPRNKIEQVQSDFIAKLKQPNKTETESLDKNNLPAVPIGDNTISANLPDGDKIITKILEFSDGTKKVETYINDKLVNGSTKPTQAGLPIPIGEDVVKGYFENGDEYNIVIINKMDGSKTVSTYVNDKLVPRLGESNIKTPQGVVAEGGVKVKSEAEIKELVQKMKQETTIASRSLKYYGSSIEPVDYNDFKILDNLNESDKTNFANLMEWNNSANTFLLFASGNKPALLFADYNNTIGLVDKIKSDEIDIVHRTLQYENSDKTIENAFIINKKQVQEIISNNKEIFQTRMEMDTNASVEEIYAKLISEDSPLKEEYKYSDLIGLTLGYPKNNTLIYELEQCIPDFNPQIRYHNDLTEYKNTLINVLYGDNSPYKNMSDEFKTNLANKINNMQQITSSAIALSGNNEFSPYPFVAYVDEPSEINRIQNQIVNTSNIINNHEFGKGSKISLDSNSTLKTSQGMTAEDNGLISQARKNNPAEVAVDKVKEQWQQSDLEVGVPEQKVDLFNLDNYAGLKELAPEIKNQVTDLILKGKLETKLTERYEKMADVFNEIAQKRNHDIQALASKYANDNQKFADEYVKILCEELGMQGFEPPVKFTSLKDSDGSANWPQGRIDINQNLTNKNDIVNIISHEFIHMMQFRDVLAQYGEKGLRDLINNDKSIAPALKEQYISQVINNPYNQKLLAQKQQVEQGTVNDYIVRIYKDEFTNTVGTDNMSEYTRQLAEREAYNLGSENLGNRVTVLPELSATEVAALKKNDANVSISSNGTVWKINDDGSVTRLGIVKQTLSGIVSDNSLDILKIDFNDENAVNAVFEKWNDANARLAKVTNADDFDSIMKEIDAFGKFGEKLMEVAATGHPKGEEFLMKFMDTVQEQQVSMQIVDNQAWRKAQYKGLSGIVDRDSTRPKLEEPSATSKPKDKAKLKSVEVLSPDVKPEAFELTGRQLTKEVPNPNSKKESDKTMRVLTPEGEELVWQAARGLRENALKVEGQIVEFMHSAGLGTESTLKHRSKSEQSLHDKLKNYLAENPDATFADAMRDVRDYVATRTINKSSDLSKHPEVAKLREKGDIKSAINKAVEIESEYVLENLKSIIDKMADGTSDIIITRFSNYMGEDGIPYFTEKQLQQLAVYAESKGISLPIETRVLNVEDRSSLNNIYSDDASTKVRKSGYTAFQMNFVTKDGDVFEWQYRGDKLNDFGEGEHVPYDLRTGKDIIGKDVILTDLYQPMKELLTDESKMPDELYKEYNAYLTAHYKYLREVELGFVEPGNPPKLPAGIDARLRADNLILLHEIADNLKKGKIKKGNIEVDYTKEQALADYQKGLIQNTENNVTTESYVKKMKDTKANANIDRHELIVRLGENTKPTLLKACQDSKGNVKNELVLLVEEYRSKGLEDKSIEMFINRFKNDDGKIDPEVFKNLNQFINLYANGKLESPDRLPRRAFELYSAMPLKNGQKVVDESFMQIFLEVAKTHLTTPEEFKIISDLLPTIDQSQRNGVFKFLVDYCSNIKNGNTQSKLTNKELEPILKSIFDKDGKVDDNAVNFAFHLSKISVSKEDIADIVNLAKNPTTGKIDNDTKKFLDIYLLPFDKYKLLSTSYGSNLIKQMIVSVKIPKFKTDENGNFVKDKNGNKIVESWIPNKALMDMHKILGQSLPRNGENIFVMFSKVTSVLKRIKNNDGTVNPEKQNIAIDLLKNKFSIASLDEIIPRCFDKNGNYLKDNYLAFIKNYNSLSESDKANLTQVNVKLEAGILRQTMYFKDGPVKVFDINSNNLNEKNNYGFSRKKGKNNNFYLKLQDTVRGKTSKVTSKNGKTTAEVTIIYDKQGNKIGTEYVSEASIGNGVLDVRFRDNDGNTHILSGAEKDSNGNIRVTKDFTSTNGTRTQYDYLESPDGSSKSTYVVTDAQGKVLLEEARSFKVIDKNNFVSTINGLRYEISIDELNVLTVTNNKGEMVHFDLDKFTNDKYEKFKDILKNIPGHEFFNMAKVELKGFDTEQRDNAAYHPGTNDISFGPGHDVISTFFHEFGHNKDWRINSNDRQNAIRYNDQEFLDIYAKERKAFMEEFPNLQRDFVSYFVSLDNVNSRKNQSPAEVVAEANSILSTPYQGEGMEFRKYYLQRYFPESIAYLAKKLNLDVYNN